MLRALQLPLDKYPAGHTEQWQLPGHWGLWLSHCGRLQGMTNVAPGSEIILGSGSPTRKGVVFSGWVFLDFFLLLVGFASVGA